jgi:hypothetical protein
MEPVSKRYTTTIDGVVGFMKAGEAGFNFLVLKDITGVRVALHITDGAVKDLAERFIAGAHPFDGGDPMRASP